MSAVPGPPCEQCGGATVAEAIPVAPTNADGIGSIAVGARCLRCGHRMEGGPREEAVGVVIAPGQLALAAATRRYELEGLARPWLDLSPEERMDRCQAEWDLLRPVLAPIGDHLLAWSMSILMTQLRGETAETVTANLPGLRLHLAAINDALPETLNRPKDTP